MNPIRPSALTATPQATSAPPRPDAPRLAAQRAFFDMIAGKAAAPSAAASAPAEAVAAAPQRTPQPGAEAPAKVLRPGSLLDIRV